MEEEQMIFVVDDDAELCAQTGAYLEQYGFRARGFHNTRDLRQALATENCAVILLDIMLPGEDGLSFFRSLDEDRPKVIILSALGDETSKVLGLELGAEDYMVKPFSMRELVARVRNLCRREGAQIQRRPCVRYHFTGWTLETSSRILLDSRKIAHNLSGAEYRLLKTFLDNPNQLLSRERIWQELNQGGGDVNDRALDVQISKLRTRLGESAKEPKLVRTSRGDGYIFAADVLREYADGQQSRD